MANLGTYIDRSITSCEAEVTFGLLNCFAFLNGWLNRSLPPQLGRATMYSFELLPVEPLIATALSHIQGQSIELDDTSSTAESESSSKGRGTALNDEEAKDLCNWLEVTYYHHLFPPFS